MKKITIFSGLFALAASATFAEPDYMVGAGATADAGAAAQSQSSSGSTSQSAIVQHNYASNGVRYSGSHTVKNVPAVSAPGVVTAHNCALGISGGASGPGFGLSFGGSRVDENCETISQAAAINQLVGANAAVTHLAQIPEVCRTLRRTGHLASNAACPGEPVVAPRAATAPSKSPRPQTRPVAMHNASAAYARCEMKGDRIVFKKAKGYTSAAAKAACLKTMGY